MLRKMSTFLVVFFVINLYALSRLFDFIRGKYGHEALQLARRWERKVFKLEKLKCDIKFLLHCKRTNLIPKFAGPQLSINTDSNLTSKNLEYRIDDGREFDDRLDVC